MSITMISSINDLFDTFKIKARCINAQKHRHFAFYDIELNAGARVRHLTAYAEELAIAMRANSSLIFKSIPSKGIVRLQTTHKEADTLMFDELYAKHTAPAKQVLPFLLGETDEGKPLWLDMARNPHLLIAGSTGSGKSVLLHTIIANAAKRKDVRLFLVDTKRVEFSAYDKGALDGVVRSISYDYESAMDTLEDLDEIMENRYQYMSQEGFNSIEDMDEPFYKNLLIIDEAADLMLYDKKHKHFESLVAKLAQKARAAGIYMVFATQRPSVDVFTGVIKANFPARLSCKVTSKVDSKVILDQQGAESLIGRGDAILNNSSYDMTRLQVAYTEPRITIESAA